MSRSAKIFSTKEYDSFHQSNRNRVVDEKSHRGLQAGAPGGAPAQPEDESDGAVGVDQATIVRDLKRGDAPASPAQPEDESGGEGTCNTSPL